MKPLYIFDLDGTLALIEHRRHFVEGEKKDWPGFFAACVDDVRNEPVIRTLFNLSISAEIWIWSGRSDEVRAQTENWLHNNGIIHKLRMRKAGDHQPDTKLKASWIADFSAEERARLVAVFDDRSSVVEMWREHGIPCFQVARGEF